MTTATSTNSPRVLMPTAENFPHEGAAFVRLSPHKSLRNAAIIYDSIKNLDDNTIIRGDFDHKSRPYIFFPEAPQEKEIKKLTTITLRNIEANRKEMNNFLSAIVQDGINIEKPVIKVRSASLELMHSCTQIQKAQKDFVVGDIKASLETLAKAYYADQLQKKTSPHRLMGKQTSKIQNKRLREFVAIPGNTALDICAALRKNAVGKYDTRPETAVYAIKSIVKDFLNQNATSSKSLANFLRLHAFDPDIQFFAERWKAITFPKMTDERIQFSTESWAKELDRICEIIVKSNRRSTQLKPIDSSGAEGVGAQMVSQGSGVKPLVLPKPVVVVYSSLNSEDTDDTSSFPSSPYQSNQTRSSSARSASAAPLIAGHSFAQASHYLDPAIPQDPASDYWHNQSGQEEMDGAQSTLSPVDVNKLSFSLKDKFRYQPLATGTQFLPIEESDESLKRNERRPLLNDVFEESDQMIQSSYKEEKM